MDTIVGSRHENMKDSGRAAVAVPKRGSSPAFDPRRRAILLVAGDKSRNWIRWYRDNIAIADDRFDQHLQDLKRRKP